MAVFHPARLYDSRVTYNFDPEQWLQAQLARIDRRHADGEIGDAERRAALHDAHRRYDQMVERLDGTYQIPPPRRQSDGGGE